MLNARRRSAGIPDEEAIETRTHGQGAALPHATTRDRPRPPPPGSRPVSLPSSHVAEPTSDRPRMACQGPRATNPVTNPCDSHEQSLFTLPPSPKGRYALSFGYTVLCHEIRATLEVLGLDPHIGVLHECAPNRPALALDIVEPFRAVIVDQCVIKAANLNQLKATDFTRDPDEGYRLTDDSRGRFISLLERRLSAECPAWINQVPRDPRPTLREVLHGRCTEVSRWYRRFAEPASIVGESDGFPFELQGKQLFVCKFSHAPRSLRGPWRPPAPPAFPGRAGGPGDLKVICESGRRPPSSGTSGRWPTPRPSR